MSEPLEIKPFQSTKFGERKPGDFRPKPIPAGAQQETSDAGPKDSSAQEPAKSSDSPNDQTQAETASAEKGNGQTRPPAPGKPTS